MPASKRALFRQREADFQRWVVQLARLARWSVVEMPRYVMRCPRCQHPVHFPLVAGIPDLPYLIHPERKRFLVRELKADDGQVRAGQAVALSQLRAVGIDAGIWRPADRDVIERELLG